VLAAVVQHYMLEYRIVLDPSMLANAMQTDAHEARDLLSWRLLFDVLLVTVPAAVALWWIPIIPMRAASQAWRNALLLLAAVALAAAAATAMNRQLAPLMRNNVHMRYMMNPLASVYSATSVVVKPWFKHSRKLLALPGGVALGASYAAQTRPPLFVLVVGETARADHFALNGYARDTTPELAARGVLSWRDVHSCGTNTLASVPCMFSPLGKSRFESDEHRRQENLLDVLAHAGLSPQWFDNNTGSKRVATRTGEASMALASDSPSCNRGSCFDEVLVEALQSAATAATHDTVIVLHQLGSHGPSYFERYPPQFRRFVPTCDTNQLQRCTRAEILNTYDNTIVYTDHVLDRLIAVLESQRTRFDAALLYVSDHGESTGEHGLYLHGMPYAMAPDEQTHVPMIAWISDGYARAHAIDRACLDSQRDRPLSHDNLFHSMLGVLDVETSVYRSELDLFAPCRISNARH